MKKIWVVVVLLVSGCASHSLEELRHTQPRGSEFQQALAREYLGYAVAEEQNYDWADAWHFADKGLIAAYGHDVGPENPADWDIQGEDLIQLEQARDDLLTALTPAVVEAKPLLAARAYREYDCWVERAEDGWEHEKIAACRDAFRDSLAELSSPQMAALGVGGVDTTAYLVFFDWNKATLNEMGQAIVADVIATLAGEEGYEIILNGHTDTTGLERFNLRLSKRRAEAVERALVRGGIARKHIQIFAFGESDPRVPTADGVNEPQNRRVEIFIQ